MFKVSGKEIAISICLPLYLHLQISFLYISLLFISSFNFFLILLICMLFVAKLFHVIPLVLYHSFTITRYLFSYTCHYCSLLPITVKNYPS